MNKIILPTIISILSASAIAQDIDEISELSGYRLGEKIHQDSDGIIQCGDNKITCWGTNRDMTPVTYDVQLSINSNREIFRIYATKAVENPDTLERCLTRAKQVVNGYEKHHKIVFKSKELKNNIITSFSWISENIKKSSIKMSISCERLSIPGLPSNNPIYVLGISISDTGIMGDI